MKGAAIRCAEIHSPISGRRFDIEPWYERMSLIWKIVISRWILDISLCRICIHTGARTPSRAHRAAVHCAVDAVTMQSPMQFRAIQVRLALCTSDMVTVYPSPTHTRIEKRESKNTGRRESRTDASDDTIRAASVGRAAAVDAALVLYVPTRGRGC